MFKNGFLIMDGFVDRGYTVLGLDYFRGVSFEINFICLHQSLSIFQDPVWKHRKSRTDTTTEPGFDYEAWKKKHQDFCVNAVPAWNKAVKEKYGKPGTKYACVG